MSNEKTEEKKYAKVKYVQKILVKDIVLEASFKNEKDLSRIRFVCDDGKEITCRLVKTMEEIKSQSIFKVKTTKKDVYTIDDLERDHPVLVLLYTDCMTKPQEIIISYFENEFENKEGGEDKTYFYMKDYQLKHLYYSGFHTDMKNVEKQEEWKSKVVKVDMPTTEQKS